MLTKVTTAIENGGKPANCNNAKMALSKDFTVLSAVNPVDEPVDIFQQALALQLGLQQF